MISTKLWLPWVTIFTPIKKKCSYKHTHIHKTLLQTDMLTSAQQTLADFTKVYKTKQQLRRCCFRNIWGGKEDGGREHKCIEKCVSSVHLSPPRFFCLSVFDPSSVLQGEGFMWCLSGGLVCWSPIPNQQIFRWKCRNQKLEIWL